jgi:hypothetical protein
MLNKSKTYYRTETGLEPYTFPEDLPSMPFLATSPTNAHKLEQTLEFATGGNNSR